VSELSLIFAFRENEKGVFVSTLLFLDFRMNPGVGCAPAAWVLLSAYLIISHVLPHKFNNHNKV
jgi:hypothetical protein